MGIEDSEVSRLLAGEVPSDDPQLGKVSAFLSSLEAACPPSDVSAFEDHHLALVAREARLVGASRRQASQAAATTRARTRARRAFASVSAGVLVMLSAGVGVAAAMGVSPLQLVPALITAWTEPADHGRTVPPTPQGTGGPTNGQYDPTTQPPVVDPTAPPTAAGQPTGIPTTSSDPGNCGNGKGAGNATCTNGKSGDDKPAKPKPTPHRPTKKPVDPPPGKGQDGKGQPTPAKPAP